VRLIDGMKYYQPTDMEVAVDGSSSIKRLKEET